ncbi:hypothetical protein [Ruegeria profundi]|uniref:hypothetical protein n=1 Tax=Ruegeria profundi TaxID=1685378 RepID=UPI003C7C7C1B
MLFREAKEGQKRGLFGNMSPRTANIMQGIGLGLSQLDAGRMPNLSPVYSRMQEQDRQKQMQEAIGPALERMDPAYRQVLASMPPALAAPYIMKLMQPEAPQKGVVVGNRLVNPVTGDVMGDYSSEKPRRIITGADGFQYYEDGSRVLPDVEAQQEGWRALTPDERQSLPNLDPNKSYQVGVSGANKGKIAEVGGNGTNVTVHTGVDGSGRYLYGSDAGLPQGWRLDVDTQTASVIPGGPAAMEAQAAEAADAKAEQAKSTSAHIVLDEIGMVKELIGDESMLSPATGVTGGLMSNIDSTRAGAVKNRLSTIKANIGFDKLQSMRDASPTGGALGQVSEFENRLLQAVFGSLEQAQSAKDIMYNLDRLEAIYNRIIHQGIPDDEARKMYREIELGDLVSGGSSSTDATPEAPQAGVVEDGFRFLGGDPSDPSNWEEVN